MKRFVYFVILVSMLGLAACSGGGAPAATIEPTAAPTTAVVPTVQTTDPVTLGKLGDPTACNLVGMLPEPVAGLSPVSAADWVMGNRDARVTILEYSDYQ